MSAGYSGLPREQREAYEAQMRSHERAYSGVRQHALAGADSDFDKPLRAGEREHQRHLRSQEGLQHADVLRTRRELRGERGGQSRSRRRSSSGGSSGTFAGPRAAKAAAGAAGGALGGVTGGGGNTVLYFVGVMLGLSLIYLLVAGKGAKAVTGITNTVVGAVHTFIAPVDPIAAAERALGAGSVSSSTPSSSSSGSAPGSPSGASLTPQQSAAASPFGTAPSPTKAAALTPASLSRAIRAHKLTPAQVRADLKILYPAPSHN